MMNRLFAMFFLLAFFACQEDSTSSKASTQTASQDNALNGTAEIREITGRMSHVIPYIWWYEGYVSSRPEYKAEQKGKWFKFSPDGTFVYGRWQEEIGKGTWSYEEASEKLLLYTPGGTESLEWKTMMSKTNDKMVWIGPPRGQNAGDQAMLNPYLQKPNPSDIFTW